MKTKTRHTLAAALSFVVHGGLVLSTVDLVPDLEMPDLEFEFTEVEMLDPDMLQGDEPAGQVEEPPPVLQPEPPPPGEEPGPDPEENSPEEEEPQEKRALGEKDSRVDQLGPTNSTFYAMLVPKKIRKLKFREHAMDIMAPLPDFDYLIGKGGFDALRDFDHIVIASPDIRDITQTFLAVDYTVSRAEVKAAIERAAAVSGESIEWIEEEGIVRGNPTPIDPDTPDVDPRWFVLLEDDIAVYVRREFLPHILKKGDTDLKTAGNYVANLAKLRRFASRQPTAGLQIVLKDLRAALKRARGLPFEVPDRIELSAEAKSEPELMIRVGFLTAVDSRQAEKWWKEDLAKIIDDNITVKLTAKWIYDLLEVERDGKELRLWGKFTEQQAEQVLELIADLSAKMVKRSPEEVEKARQQRIENWKKRNRGKLPPSALDAEGARPPGAKKGTGAPPPPRGDAGGKPVADDADPPSKPDSAEPV